MNQSDLGFPTAWPTASLVDCTEDGQISYGVVQPGQPCPGGIPIFRVNNIGTASLDTTDVLRISPEIEEKYQRTRLRGGEILLSVVGTAGRVVVAPPTFSGWNVARAIAVIRPRRDVGAEWLKIWLESTAAQAYLDARANTTVQKTLNLKDVRSLPVPLPSEDIREGILKVILPLEDRIRLLREQNKTLEAMARAIFKSWFVDFDPVRAEAEGREPEGMDAPTAALFPSEFQDSELGQIPKGWKVTNVGELCTRVSMGPFGSNIKTDNFIPAGVPVVRGGNLKAGFLDDDFVYVSEAKASELRNSIACPGDLVITHRGTLGQVGLIPRNSRFQRYIVSQSQMLLSVNKALASPMALYLFLTSPDGQQRLLANTNQTGVPAIARPTTSVKAIKIIVPSDARVITSFEETTSVLFDRMTANDHLVRALSGLRGTLLPRLISGKLRVLEAEGMLAEAL